MSLSRSLKLDHAYVAEALKDCYSQFVQSRLGRNKFTRYLAIGFGCLGLRYLFWRIYRKLRRYPPGPIGLPFVGCFLSFARSPLQALHSYGHRYGAVALVPMLRVNNLFINDVKVLDQLYKQQAINDRYSANSWREHRFFANISGKSWKTRRQLFVSTVLTLTNSSWVQEKMDAIVDTHIVHVVFEKHIQGQELFVPSDYLPFIAFNTGFSATFDLVVPFDDPFIAGYIKRTDHAFKQSALSRLLDWSFGVVLPAWLNRRLCWSAAAEQDACLIDWLNKSGEFVVDAKNSVFKRSEKSRGSGVYVDRLIERLNEKLITFDELMADLSPTIQAGIHTTSSAGEYVLLLLAKHSDVQERIYAEMTAVIKANTLDRFDLSIVNELHLLRAFLHDALRIAAIAPTGIPHFTAKATTLELEDGTTYNIPKNTFLHCNTLYMSRYRDWANNGQPMQAANTSLHLEYWLDAESKRFKMNDNFVLFGSGKRDCAGRALAMRSLYGLMGSLMTRYRFITPHNDKSFEIKQKLAVTLTVEPKIGLRIEQR